MTSPREQAFIIAYAAIALSGAKYKEIPAKVRWVAQDNDGSWWWYLGKPTIRQALWFSETGKGKRFTAGTPPVDFTQTRHKLY